MLNDNFALFLSRRKFISAKINDIYHSETTCIFLFITIY